MDVLGVSKKLDDALPGTWVIGPEVANKDR
jgi:hypothetical protein